MRPPLRPISKGFTLVEMLLAIAIMAVMAGLSWRGLDAMAQSKSRNDAYREQVLALQASMAQWGTDLDAMQQPNAQTPLEAKAGTLRFVRQAPTSGLSDTGYVVVVYAQESRAVSGQPNATYWVRWQSEPFNNHQGLATAWSQSTAWLSASSDPTRLDTDTALVLARIQSWRVRFFVDGQWQDAPPAASFPSDTLPYDGLRLELELASGQSVSGRVTRDWISPRAGGTR